MLMPEAKASRRGMLGQQKPAAFLGSQARGTANTFRGGDAHPGYHALKDISLSSAPHEGSGSRPAGATEALPRVVQRRLAGTPGRLSQGRENGHSLRPDEIPDGNQGRAAGIRGRLFAGASRRSQATGEGIQGFLSQSQGRPDTGLSTLQRRGLVRLHLLSAIRVQRVRQDRVLLKNREHPNPAAPSFGRQTQDGHHPPGVRGVVRQLRVRGGSCPAARYEQSGGRGRGHHLVLHHLRWRVRGESSALSGGP